MRHEIAPRLDQGRVAVEALVGEELEPEAGEPRVGGVRGGAEVVGDLVLEGAVVDGVQDGGMAMDAFMEAIDPKTTPGRRDQIEKN